MVDVCPVIVGLSDGESPKTYSVVSNWKVYLHKENDVSLIKGSTSTVVGERYFIAINTSK